MDLFVVNRYTESNDGEPDKDDEAAKLQKLLQRVEKNRKTRLRQKEKLKEKQEIKKRCIEVRKKKREIKGFIVPVPEGPGEFLDENIKDPIAESEVLNEEITEAVETSSEKKIDDLGFTILGGDQFDKKNRVKRVLPKWLLKPKVISVDLQKLEVKTSSLKQLDKSLREKLKEAGIKYFFPVQAEVIPYLLKSNNIRESIRPNDICVSAPTGSGKTLAFVLPIIQALKTRNIKAIRALVILPTQDLALQVFKTFRKFTVGSDLDVCLITGRSPFEQEQKQLISENQAFGFISKVDILVCTAGRLVDHLKTTRGFSLEHLEFLVIDEADRVLDTVQNDWLYHLEKHIYSDGVNSIRALNLNTLNSQKRLQKLLFSATLSQDPEKLEKLGLFQPKLFTSIIETNENIDENESISNRFIGKYTTPKELTEKFISSSLDLKPLVLYEFIKLENLTKSIVFTHSLESTHRLCLLLRSLFNDEKKIEELGSKLEPKVRDKLIDDFEKGNIDVLVCTDGLARGIDLAGVRCVVSYSAPKYLKTYIHRAGRTARAGEAGLAVTMVHRNQVARFQTMIRQAGKTGLEEIKIDEVQLEKLGDQYKEALVALKASVDAEEGTSMKRIRSAQTSLGKRKKKTVL